MELCLVDINTDLLLFLAKADVSSKTQVDIPKKSPGNKEGNTSGSSDHETGVDNGFSSHTTGTSMLLRAGLLLFPILGGGCRKNIVKRFFSRQIHHLLLHERYINQNGVENAFRSERYINQNEFKP